MYRLFRSSPSDRRSRTRTVLSAPSGFPNRHLFPQQLCLTVNLRLGSPLPGIAPASPLLRPHSRTPLSLTGPSQRLQFSVPPRTWHPPQLSNERKNGKNECTARWCNGNTTDFGSVILGSNPSRVTSHLFGPPLPPDSHANFLREDSREDIFYGGIFYGGNLSLGKGLDFLGFGLPAVIPRLRQRR